MLSIKCFWAMKKTITTGNNIITAAAIKIPYSVFHQPVLKINNPSGSGILSSEFRKINGRRKSFQVAINWKITTAASAGRMSGNEI